ncbi:hypothetical protein [Bradyrhizobium sp. Leo170]|uniref:hypothetical protein n=2 Tax=unclassified Bradyrhizobium TaxID=2631580 RepID=UPI00102EC1D7|nr:hypothetical protein [Bradyrhizobium sp. Leo170]TAI60132.1 hypothetical protein CWO89_42375 [Bradyrhizobium sp. Leo170]
MLWPIAIFPVGRQKLNRIIFSSRFRPAQRVDLQLRLQRRRSKHVSNFLEPCKKCPSGKSVESLSIPVAKNIPLSPSGKSVI